MPSDDSGLGLAAIGGTGAESRFSLRKNQAQDLSRSVLQDPHDFVLYADETLCLWLQ